MKPADYWKKRGEQIAKLQFDKADAYEASLRQEYERAKQGIQRQIEVFYHRYAANEEISLAEAKKQLSGRELKEFKMTLEEFTAKAKNNADGRWTKELNNVYYRTRVSRLETLQVQIQHQVEMLAGSRQQGARELLGGIYEDSYYRTIFELQKGTGIGASFGKIDQTGLEKVLGTEFAGSNWSQRIWGDRDKLMNELRTKLSQSLIRGDAAEKTIRDLSDRMDVSRSNAERLVQTESAFFAGQAAMDGYKASALVQEYEILATLDSRTTPVCRSMDGKVFKLNEMEVGVNYPPFHARCRTTQAPYFADEVDPGERIARDKDGRTYYVPGDMKYEDWKKQHVDHQGLGGSGPPGGRGSSFSPAVSINDAEDFARKELGFTKADYSGLELDSVNALNEAMKTVYDRYPEIKGFVGEIAAIDSDEFVAAASVRYDGDKVLSELTISRQYYKISQIGDIIEAGVNAKHWPPGTNQQSIFIHEFGHILEYAHALKKRGSWTGQSITPDDVQLVWADIQNGTLSKQIRAQAMKNLGIADTHLNITNELSNYANTNSKEFLAESFAEAEGTADPRRLAVETVRIFREKLKEVGIL